MAPPVFCGAPRLPANVPAIATSFSAFAVCASRRSTLLLRCLPLPLLVDLFPELRGFHQGFGYGVAIVADSDVIGPSVGSFHWPGASGCDFIVDPREETIAVVLMQQYSYGVSSKVVRDVLTAAYAAIVN